MSQLIHLLALFAPLTLTYSSNLRTHEPSLISSSSVLSTATESHIPTTEHDIQQMAHEMIHNERHFTWNKHLSGNAWEFGTCTNSTAFGVPQFGARWPLKAGWMTWYDQIPADDGVTAYSPRKVYMVLNQQYLSSFTKEEDARACQQPIDPPMDIALLMGANAGGEPVLISARDDTQNYCIHLRFTNQQDIGTISIFCTNDLVDRREWLDYLQDVIKTQRKTAAEPAARIPEAKFAQAPRTICTEQPTMCLTNVPIVHENLQESSTTSNTDDIRLMSSKWIKSFPITPIKAQEWHVEQSTGKEHKPGTVNLCSSSGKCLTVLQKIETSGLIPKEARKFIDCPGGNLKCFDMKDITVGMTPTLHATDVCRNECDRENLCQGWVYTRPLATGTGFAKCCMKKRDMSLTCGENRCCDAHMKSETKNGHFISNGAKTPNIPNALKMAKYDENNLYQQWKIVPEQDSMTKAKLKMGDLCISMDVTSSLNSMVMMDCHEESSIVFNFYGFLTEEKKE